MILPDLVKNNTKIGINTDSFVIDLKLLSLLWLITTNSILFLHNSNTIISYLMYYLIIKTILCDQQGSGLDAFVYSFGKSVEIY